MRAGALVVLLALGCAPLAHEPAPLHPNIVIILADDIGFSDVGCYGAEIATPNVDRLAAEGLRFTQFYNTSRCCPTRASLLTGLYPHQAGVGDMIENRGLPGYQGFLNDRCVTMAEVLRSHGYRTLMSGKWHLGEERPRWPVDRGFDRSFALLRSSRNYFDLGPFQKLVLDDQLYTPPEHGFYLTDAYTDHALRFLDEAGRDQKPFLLYLAHSAAHFPLHAWPGDIAWYRGQYKPGWDVIRNNRYRRLVELGLVDSRWPLSPRDAKAPAWAELSEREKDLADLKMAVYAAQIDRMDQGIGKVLAKIRQMGAEENTLVIFLSDNGGCAEEEEEIRRLGRPHPGAPIGTKDSFTSCGLPWANVSNTPFRRFKKEVHEGGIATPFVVRWPAVIRRSGIVHAPAHLIDLMPACLDAAGAPYPQSFQGREILPLEGRSLVPVFKSGKGDGERHLFWEHEGNRAVRRGRWKLVALHGGAWELYDLEADRTELKDLASRHPEIVRDLAAEYERWARRCGVLPWEEVRKRP